MEYDTSKLDAILKLSDSFDANFDALKQEGDKLVTRCSRETVERLCSVRNDFNIVIADLIREAFIDSRERV